MSRGDARRSLGISETQAEALLRGCAGKLLQRCGRRWRWDPKMTPERWKSAKARPEGRPVPKPWPGVLSSTVAALLRERFLVDVDPENSRYRLTSKGLLAHLQLAGVIALDVELARASSEPDHVEATPEIVAAAVELGLEDAGLHEQPEEPAAAQRRLRGGR